MTSQVSGELNRLKLAAWPTVRKEQAPRLTLSFDERADCVFIMTPSLFGHSVSRAAVWRLHSICSVSDVCVSATLH